MKGIKDLTDDQIKEIANLAFSNPRWITSKDYIITYKPFEKADLGKGYGYEDSHECIVVIFKAIAFGDKEDKIRLFINGNLNLSMDVFRTKPIKIIDLGISHQHEIFEKFREWDTKPNPFWDHEPTESELKQFNRENRLNNLLDEEEC